MLKNFSTSTLILPFSKERSNNGFVNNLPNFKVVIFLKSTLSKE